MRRRGRPGLIGLAARTAVVAGTANAVSGAMNNSRQEKAATEQQAAAWQAQQQQAAMDAAAAQAVAAAQMAAPAPVAAAPVAAAPAVDIVAELQKLAGLQQAGILTPEEFAAAKAKLLG
jgi:hypothetical protein